MSRDKERRRLISAIQQGLDATAIVEWKLTYNGVLNLLRELIHDGLLVRTDGNIVVAEKGLEFMASELDDDERTIDADELAEHQQTPLPESSIQLPSSMRGSQS